MTTDERAGDVPAEQDSGRRSPGSDRSPIMGRTLESPVWLLLVLGSVLAGPPLVHLLYLGLGAVIGDDQGLAYWLVMVVLIVIGLVMVGLNMMVVGFVVPIVCVVFTLRRDARS